MITRASYVKRLEKMLRVDEPCGGCPVHKGADFKGDCLESCKKPGWGSIWMDGRVCVMCKDFIDAPAVLCPCHSFKRKTTALKRAGKAIMAYKAKEHKWNKEGSDGKT